jgi:preprotein translocase subunit SecG
MTIELSNAVLFQPLLGAPIGLTLLQLLLFFVSLWLIFLILIQRGKGGGLTAAFGGGGGDSAFGAKAGDAFTKITIVSSLIWITLCMVTIALYNPPAPPNNPYDTAQQEAQDDTPSLGGPSLSPAEGDEDAAADGDSSESGEESSSASGDDDAAANNDSNTEAAGNDESDQ